MKSSRLEGMFGRQKTFSFARVTRILQGKRQTTVFTTKFRILQLHKLYPNLPSFAVMETGRKSLHRLLREWDTPWGNLRMSLCGLKFGIMFGCRVHGARLRPMRMLQRLIGHKDDLTGLIAAPGASKGVKCATRPFWLDGISALFPGAEKKKTDKGPLD